MKIFQKNTSFTWMLSFLIALFAIQTVGSPALAASLSGKPCSQKAAVKVYQGKKFTCVLSKNKLVWNKGAAVASSPTAKPTPSTSTSPVISPNELLAKNILALYKSSELNKSFTFQIKTCPNVNKKKSDETIAAYERALKFWTHFYSPTKPMNWVMFSENDFDCWLSSVKELEGDSGDTKVWNPNTNYMGHCKLASVAFCGYGTGVRPNGLFVQYNAIGTLYTRSPDLTVVNHEAVHFYQMSLESANRNTSRIGSLPPWFIEGQANLIGMTIAYNGVANSRRNFEMGRLRTVLPQTENFTAQAWADELRSLDSRHSFVFQNELGYSLGWFSLEKVYQLYGIQKMHDLLVEINSGLDFEQALQKVLATSKEALYLAIGEYLSQELK